MLPWQGFVIKTAQQFQPLCEQYYYPFFSRSLSVMTQTRSLSRPSLFSICIVAALFFFASTAAAAEYVSVLKDEVNVRSGPDMNAEVLWTLFKGFPLQVTSRKGNWAQVVDFEGDKGWIATSLIAKQKTLIVKVDSANLRAGAGQDHEIIAEVKRGVILIPLTTQGEWIKAKHADGTTGWIFSKLLWPN
jgi:SH3-like domain-containing protein